MTLDEPGPFPTAFAAAVLLIGAPAWLAWAAWAAGWLALSLARAFVVEWRGREREREARP